MRSVWYFPAQFLRWKRRFYDFVVSEATWWNQTSGCSAAMGYLFSSETTGRGWGSADHKSVEFRQHVSRFVLSRVNRRVSIASSLPLKKDSTLPIYSLITCQDRLSMNSSFILSFYNWPCAVWPMLAAGSPLIGLVRTQRGSATGGGRDPAGWGAAHTPKPQKSWGLL